jgi:hypothetical protein
LPEFRPWLPKTQGFSPARPAARLRLSQVGSREDQRNPASNPGRIKETIGSPAK